MAKSVEDCLRRLSQLEERRQNWDTHWKEIAERVWPAADEFLTAHTPGDKRSTKIFDATAALALEKFAAAMESMLTPRAQKWHSLRSTDERLNDDPSIKAWFEEVNRVLFQVRSSPKAGYYAQMHEGYKALGAFGNACMLIDVPATGGISYVQCHIGQIYVEVNPARRVDTVYRKYSMSAKAAEQEWGRKKLPPMVLEALESDDSLYKSFEFLHVVTPRTDYDPERKDYEGMPWLSYHIGLADKEMIDEGGYHEFPFCYSRYTVNPSEVYGRSPAMLVLPSIKMAQEMAKTFIRSGHKMVDPPLLLHDDGVLGTGSKQVRLTPGGLNYGGVDAQGRPLVVPLQTGARLDISEGMLNKEREVINDAFLVTLFQILVDQPQMTATEALIRAQEKGQLLAPAVGRQQSEMLGPQIDREFNILARQGFLPPPPPALLEAQGEYEVAYESPAMRYQRSEELVGIQRTLEIAGPFAQVDPSVLQIFNGEEVIRLAAEINGAPSSILKTPEEMEEMRAEQAQAQQQQEQMAQLQQMAPAVKELAQAKEAAGPEGLGMEAGPGQAGLPGLPPGA
ncbi:MAG: phage head-tail adapter protein [Leifsonia sp.]|nr:phage head-tail adapter protein [Leifsonia sp.]